MRTAYMHVGPWPCTCRLAVGLIPLTATASSPALPQPLLLMRCCHQRPTLAVVKARWAAAAARSRPPGRRWRRSPGPQWQGAAPRAPANSTRTRRRTTNGSGRSQAVGGQAVGPSFCHLGRTGHPVTRTQLFMHGKGSGNSRPYCDHSPASPAAVPPHLLQRQRWRHALAAAVHRALGLVPQLQVVFDQVPAPRANTTRRTGCAINASHSPCAKADSQRRLARSPCTVQPALLTASSTALSPAGPACLPRQCRLRCRCPRTRLTTCRTWRTARTRCPWRRPPG